MALRKTFGFALRLVLVLEVAMGSKYTDTGLAIIGTTEPHNVTVPAGTSRQDIIAYKFASYLCVHFADFDLPEGDSVIIRALDGHTAVSHTYTGRGRDPSGTFIASFVPGSSVAVTYTSIGPAKVGQGYRIPAFARGYPTMQHESVCGDGDQSLPAKCYASGTPLSKALPHAYTRARAVARLLINGTLKCTGWLGGSEGHLFTNYHCFHKSDGPLSIDIEFDAESLSCRDQCNELPLGCPGTLVATTSTFVASHEAIDYAVVQIPDCIDLSPYGYLQVREAGPRVHEGIYLPQHPDGHAKRIVSTIDGGARTTIHSTGEEGKCGTNQVGHDADTRGGSSGSPLLAASDNLVVGIHHCGGCFNTAIDIRTVLMDLMEKQITIKNLVASGNVRQNRSQTVCTTQKPQQLPHYLDSKQNQTFLLTSNLTHYTGQIMAGTLSRVTLSPTSSGIGTKTMSRITSKVTTALTSPPGLKSTTIAKTEVDVSTTQDAVATLVTTNSSKSLTKTATTTATSSVRTNDVAIAE